MGVTSAVLVTLRTHTAYGKPPLEKIGVWVEENLKHTAYDRENLRYAANYKPTYVHYR